MFFRQLSQLFQSLSAGHCSSGVAGRVENDHAGPGGNCLGDFFYIQVKSLLGVGRHRDRDTAAHADLLNVVCPAGLVDDYLVTRLKQDLQSQKQGLHSAGGDDDLAGRIIAEPLRPVQISGDSLAQL